MTWEERAGGAISHSKACLSFQNPLSLYIPLWPKGAVIALERRVTGKAGGIEKAQSHCLQGPLRNAREASPTHGVSHGGLQSTSRSQLTSQMCSPLRPSCSPTAVRILSGEVGAPACGKLGVV